MPTVRELSTRFSFEVDPKGITKFNRTIFGMKRQILAVGAALGVGLGSRALVRFGESLERARFQAGRFSEAIRLTGKFAPDVQKKLDALRSTLGAGAFTDAQAFDAFARFANIAEDFPSLQGKFPDFFEFAVLLNKAGQLKDLGAVVNDLTESFKTGDPSFLERLPGFSDIAGAKIRKLAQIIQGAFFLPVTQRPQFFQQITQAMAELLPELEKTAIAAGETGPGALGNALTELESAAQKVGASMLKFITPAIQALTDLLGLASGENRTFPALEKMGRALGLIPDKAKAGEEAIESLISSLRTLGIAAAAGIVAGLIIGLPPIVGAAIGLDGGVGFIKLKEIVEDPDFSLKNLLPDSVREKVDALEEQLSGIEFIGPLQALENLRRLRFLPLQPQFLPIEKELKLQETDEQGNPVAPRLPSPDEKIFEFEGLGQQESKERDALDPIVQRPDRELPFVQPIGEQATEQRPNQIVERTIDRQPEQIITIERIELNITGSNPEEIGRIVVEKLSDAIGKAAIEFTNIEGVEGLG